MVRVMSIDSYISRCHDSSRPRPRAGFRPRIRTGLRRQGPDQFEAQPRPTTSLDLLTFWDWSSQNETPKTEAMKEPRMATPIIM